MKISNRSRGHIDDGLKRGKMRHAQDKQLFIRQQGIDALLCRNRKQKGSSGMKKILFVAFLLLSLIVCFTSPARASGLEDCKAYKEGEEALSEKGHYNYEKALDLYTLAILTCELPQEDLSKVYYGRGIASHIRNGDTGDKADLDNAIADLTRAIKLNPKYAKAYNHRGVVWSCKGDYDKAIADYTKAIEINPSDALFYNNRGFAWDKKGDQDKAKADYAKAKELGYK